jgi:hypothetical protein
VAQALLCTGARAQGELMVVFRHNLQYGLHLGVCRMWRMRHLANPPQSWNEKRRTIFVFAGSICNISACPVTLLMFTDDEEDFRNSSFTVSYWLVLELFEPETGIGSSMLACENRFEIDCIFLDSIPQFKGLIERLFEKARNCFDPIFDITERPMIDQEIEETSSFYMMYLKRILTESTAAKCRPGVVH